ncbi:MAG TPA: ABC transporter permease [Nitrososphaerales archaeon]|nr:ABC transporter permease [Nitrososphaerales archaeon]
MSLLSDTMSLFRRGMTKLYRNPALAVTYLFEPVAFLVLFSQMFTKLGNFLPPETGGYVAYLTPGIVVFCALITSTQSGVSIVNDMNSGFLSKILLTQSSRSAILLGRLLTDMALAIAESIIAIAVAMVMGVTIYYGFPGLLLILLTVAAFEVAFSGLFLAVGIITRKTETLSAVSGFLYLPLLFLSTAMFPAAFLPGWAQTASDYNPVTYVANGVRELVSGGLNITTIADAYLLTGAIALVTFAVTLYRFRKVVS